MNKLIPYAIVVLMIAMLSVSWKNIRNYYTAIDATYDYHIETAEKLEAKKIYIDAVAEYEAALRMKPDNFEIAMKIKDLYIELEQRSNYISACQKALSIDPTYKDLYLELIDCYLESNTYTEALKLADTAEKYIGVDNDISERVIQIKGRYGTSSYGMNIVKPLYYIDNSNGYYVIEQDGLYGLVNAQNAVLFDCVYQDIGLLSDSLIPVKKNDEYYYLNSDGYRKLVPDEKAEYLGTFGNGYAPAKFNGTYGYVNNRLAEFHFEYDYAGCFANGIAAVQKGDKWGIINTNFEEVTGFVFDEIVMNEYDFCSAYGVFFARKGDTYALYDKSGTELASGFSDVDMFASDEPAAVKIGDKWGYITKAGETFIEPKYEQAKSFCVGYGPFLENGKWGCIDKAENILIEPTFNEMRAFTKNGIASIVTDELNGYISVNIYD